MTGIGPVAVRCPRVRDRVGEGSGRIRFSSAILPPYARRSKSLEVLIPILYLKGVSTGDFDEALIALLGKDAGGLSATTSDGLRRPGRRSMRAGASAISPPSVTSTSGPTVSTSRPGSRTLRNACWSSSVPRPRARRSWSACSTVCARVRNPRRSYCST
jgi:Transposase, Mutator family